MGDAFQTRLHATTVSWKGRAAMLVGPSGSGKSSLALQLMALGCDLVSDDQTEITREGERLIARAPKAIKGKIEARGFAILDAATIDQSEIVCVIDLGVIEKDRLPQDKSIEICGKAIKLFHNPGKSLLQGAVLQYLKHQ